MEKMPLDDILREIIGGPFKDGTSHTYFQPPANIQLHYPCIEYNFANDEDYYADNKSFINYQRYSVTVIDEDPDSKIYKKLKERLPYCSLDRVYSYDGLMHFVMVLYFNGPRIKEEKNE